MLNAFQLYSISVIERDTSYQFTQFNPFEHLEIVVRNLRVTEEQTVKLYAMRPPLFLDSHT